ncbi:MAG: hypothetical protein ACOYOT_04670 [Bacteroidales bacterium]
MIVNILLLVSAYLFMEFVAWSNHKYVMHIFLWKWHKDHHINDLKRPDEAVQENNGLEKNDLFFLIYATPAIVLMICGFIFKIESFVYIAAGITLYGFTYFVVHDVIYHKRIRVDFLQNSKNRYLRAIVKAHKAHHKPQNATDFDNFGLLIFSKRYFND